MWRLLVVFLAGLRFRRQNFTPRPQKALLGLVAEETETR